MKPNLPSGIKKIALELNNLSNIDNNMVAEIVSGVKLSEKELRQYISFDHPNYESYGRKLILDSGKFQIFLMSWRAGDFTAIHNHGYTEWGCVYFFGEATHRLYRIADDELKAVQKDNFHDGQIVGVSGALTHMMGNENAKDYTTLHIYGSNAINSIVSENTKVYLFEFQKVVRTMGSAYLNIDRSLVLFEKPLLKIHKDVFLDYYSLVKSFYERTKQFDIIRKMDKVLNNYNEFYQN
jgi:predicted metal-dependent enzyme (double-stranded beta helix superfamily)